MTRHRPALLRGCLVFFLISGAARADPPAAAQQPVPDLEIAERALARVRTLRLRIEPTWSDQPGACLDLGAADLKVSIRGQRVVDADSIDLDRAPRQTLHALLIDTSASMGGKLAEVRQVARQYIERLRHEQDKALVATFDDSVVLLQGATADRRRLLEAIERVRLGTSTALLDGLHDVIRELGVHRERPVLLVLTDGVDTVSVHDRDDVRRLAKSTPDLAIFTIGLGVPPIDTFGPSGMASTKSFLQTLARGADGSYFDAPTASRLDGIYRRIREMLDNEATLTVVDPDPEAEPGAIRVSSRKAGCQVRVLGGRERRRQDPQGGAVPGPLPPLPARIPLVSDPALAKAYLTAPRVMADPACASETASAESSRQVLWFAEVSAGRIRCCTLDLTMDTGLLYDPYQPQWLAFNGWPRLKTRELDIPIPRLEELPARPWSTLDRLAELALSLKGLPIETDWSKKPARVHARPYHDHAGLMNARTFLDLRPQLARALALHEGYRDWAMAALRREAEGELRALEERYRRRLSGYSREQVRAAALQSEEGRRIRQRMDSPRSAELEGYLAAWLGDISAHELFVRWEMDRLDLWLGGATRSGPDSFLEAWRELRRVFFVPSYARELALLAPVHDPESDRIGFWRVVLPRPAWLQHRVRGQKHHPDWGDLPLDLVPDVPLGFWLLAQVLGPDGGLLDGLRERGYRAGSLSYELRDKPRKQDPARAFRQSRIVLALSPLPAGPQDPIARLEITADVRLDAATGNPGLESISLHAQGDPLIEQLSREAQAALSASLPSGPP